MKHRILFFVAATLIAAPFGLLAESRDPVPQEDPQALFEKAGAAFQAREFPKCAGLLDRIIALLPQGDPRRPRLEQALACAYAQMGKEAEAIEHLDKAVGLGMSNSKELADDPDLAPVRNSPRFVEILKKADKNLELQNRSSSEPIFHPAKNLKKGEKSPLLILLHGMGGSPKNMEAPFLPIVEEGRWALYVPCGSIQLGANAAGVQGYNWHLAETEDILKAALALEGIDPKRIYVAGFSAGANMSYCVGLRHPDQVAGVIAFSGMLQKDGLPKGPERPDVRRVPVYIVHGKHDPGMPFNLAEEAEAYFKAGGHRVVLKGFDGAHDLSKDYLERIREAVAWFERK